MGRKEEFDSSTAVATMLPYRSQPSLSRPPRSCWTTSNFDRRADFLPDRVTQLPAMADIQIVVRMLNGESFNVVARPQLILLGVKIKIMSIKKIPYEQQRLIFDNKELKDFATLSSQHIDGNSEITLIVSAPQPAQQD